MSGTSPPRRRFAPEPIETTVKSNRKFAPVPIETTSRSSRDKTEGIASTDFARVEEPKEQPPKRRFVPEPIETTVTSNRKVNPAPELTPAPTPKERSPTNTQSASSPRPTRKFLPDLIESSVRSKKSGSRVPATLPADKTDITPGTNHIYADRPRREKKNQPGALPLGHIAPENTPASSTEDVRKLPARRPQRQGSMRPHCNTRRSTRQNSYVPDLEVIASSESSEEEEDDDDDETSDVETRTPSLSGSIGSSEDSIMRSQAARTRESCDDRFSGYLLELAAKAAEKQLREQALAAFANSDFHEPVEHYYDREIEGQSDDESIGIGLLPHEILDKVEERQNSGWSHKEMSEHLETLARLREDDTMQKVAEEAAQPSFKDPFWTNGMTAKGQDPQKEKELKKMRDAASPPMLGGSLKFRFCPSPKATTFDVDHKFDIKPHQDKEGGGLWNGYCVADEEEQYITPTPVKAPMLMQTPSVEREDPFANAFSAEVPAVKKPKTPTKGVQMVSGIDKRLKVEAEKSKLNASIQEEFDDDFVTQVFNYLSLGYPSLARHYDEEISRITKVAESELSGADNMKAATGHIGLIEGKSTSIKEIRESPRWKALRIYIVEWAKQNPSMEESAMGPSAWGVRARRGSWAI